MLMHDELGLPTVERLPWRPEEFVRASVYADNYEEGNEVWPGAWFPRAWPREEVEPPGEADEEVGIFDSKLDHQQTDKLCRSHTAFYPPPPSPLE